MEAKIIKVRKTLIFFILISLFFYYSSPIYAAKKFIKKNTGIVKKTGGVSSLSIPSVVRYKNDKLGIYFYFSNFNGIEMVNYSFTYNSNGIPQGAGGTVRAGNNPSAQRELLFGTCSSGICTYHHNLSNAKLVLTAKFTNGHTASKVYRIKTYR